MKRKKKKKESYQMRKIRSARMRKKEEIQED